MPLPVIAAGIVAAVVLYPLSRTNYLLMHSIVEIATVISMATVATIAWYTRGHAHSQYVTVIGIAYLTIIPFSAMHLLAYKGMSVMPAVGANLATQLWIIVRLSEALAFVLAGLLIRRPLNARRVLAGFLAGMALVALLAFVWPGMPVMYAEGVGLTTLKLVLEGAAIALFGVAAELLRRNRGTFAHTEYLLLQAALGAMIVTDLCFMLYVDVYGVLNFLGHAFGLLSVVLIYFALAAPTLANQVFLATHDPLTRLPTRMVFEAEVARAIAFRQRDVESSIVFADLDGFKQLNDRYGHQFGDEVLVAVADALRSATRDTDLVARIGGDEFALLLWGHDEPTAAAAVERIRATVAAVETSHGRVASLSLGVAPTRPESTYADLVATADERMYASKRVAHPVHDAAPSAAS